MLKALNNQFDSKTMSHKIRVIRNLARSGLISHSTMGELIRYVRRLLNTWKLLWKTFQRSSNLDFCTLHYQTIIKNSHKFFSILLMTNKHGTSQSLNFRMKRRRAEVQPEVGGALFHSSTTCNICGKGHGAFKCFAHPDWGCANCQRYCYGRSCLNCGNLLSLLTTKETKRRPCPEAHVMTGFEVFDEMASVNWSSDSDAALWVETSRIWIWLIPLISNLDSFSVIVMIVSSGNGGDVGVQ